MGTRQSSFFSSEGLRQRRCTGQAGQRTLHARKIGASA
jgi:hypothetical protein